MRRVSFQASGKNFKSKNFSGEKVSTFSAGEVATFGGHKGNIAPYSAALFQFSSECRDHESLVVKICRDISALLPALRSDGADAFILFVHRDFAEICNEELTRTELREIAALDCHLFYSAIQNSDAEISQ